ncbi:YwaF family protein [Pullulanibacillus pueri]|uniref:TIGR02206 family membrane protein n=1 Tax=Pullulanibacillus pueri TaxID=1437324 RepID=A0A8J3ENI6_9BACL|nr:TIGR02206 family membrane protein [Pullulanibacillus pueri]GGH84614.1 hypothetical protein GCM10007096_28100 [Pullulanibacillus pueri]
MQTYFHYHTPLHVFHAFSLQHLVTLTIIVILCALLFIFRRGVRRKRNYFRFMLAILLFVANVGLHVWLISQNVWSLKRDLPLQLSDIVVLLAIIMLLTGSSKLFQFMYFAGLGSSLQAVITPDLGKFSFPHFRYIEFFVSHGGVVLACLLMVVVYHYRPTLRALWVTFLIVNIYAGCVFAINKGLGSNYLYIMKKPGNMSLLNFLGPWPWYLLSLELVMILSFYLLYSPFWIKRREES